MKHLLMRLVLFVILAASLAFFLFSQSQEPETIHGVDVAVIDEVATPSASYTNASPDLIIVTSPTLGETLSSPITITGKARGTWYFEATAPVILVNWDGIIIAEGYVTAQDDWMTEEFVPFEGTLEFPSEPEGDPETTPALFLYPRGALIFRAANPSGLPENDRAVEISVRFFE